MARSLILGAVDGLILFAGISSAVLRGGGDVNDVVFALALAALINWGAMFVAEAAQGFREVVEVDEKLVARRKYRPNMLYRRVVYRAAREATVNALATIAAASPSAATYIFLGPLASLAGIYVVALALVVTLWRVYSTPIIFGLSLIALLTLVIAIGKTV